MEALTMDNISKPRIRSFHHSTLNHILSDVTNSFFLSSGIKGGMKGVHMSCADGKATEKLSALLNGKGTVIGVNQYPFKAQKASNRLNQQDHSIVTFFIIMGCQITIGLVPITIWNLNLR